MNWGNALRRAVTGPYRGLPKSIYILFIARIINRMGDFVQVVLVFYLSKKLGYSEAVTGLIITISGITIMVGGFAAGWGTDHWGRRRILTISMGAAALFFILCGFLPPGPAVPLILVITGFFRGAVRPVQNALVADLTEPHNRQAAYSLLYLGINIGVSVGPMIAGFLYNHYLSWIFWGDGITVMTALFLIRKYVPETKPNREKLEEMKEHHSEERSEDGGFLSVLLRRPQLLGYSFVAILTTFVYAQHRFALPLQLEGLFGEQGPRNFGLLMSFNALVVIIATPLVIRLLRRFPPLFNIALASLFYALGFGMLRYVTTLPFFYLSTLLWTLGEVAAVTNHGVFVANNTPISHRGRFSGYMSVILGAGHAFSPWMSGQFIHFFSLEELWPLVSLLSMVTVILYLLLRLYQRIQES